MHDDDCIIMMIITIVYGMFVCRDMNDDHDDDQID